MSELLEKILSNDNLNVAYKRVCANKGAGSVDDVTVELLGDYIKENWNDIKEQIRRREYKTQPVRRVEMIRTGQALYIDESFGDGFIKVTLPTEKYYRLKDAFSEHGLTVEEGLRQFVEWTVNKPDEFKAWVEECKKEGYFSEVETRTWK